MKEFCGYKSLDGSLHETQQSCQRADYEFKVQSIKNKFNVLDNFIKGRITHYFHISQGKEYIPNYFIEDTLIYIFTNYKKELVDIWKDSKLVQKELDELHEQYQKSFYKGNWWLKFKWWK